MQVLYFAWMRERIGVAAEEIPADGLSTARDLVEALKGRGGGHALAFENIDAVRVAVDQEMGTLDTPISGAREVAFFPPVTGG
ncbi:molybdopterin converting factor subunit 1 [Rhodobacteraceae bacterium NNCM2]|nr:molybdopterin converting factor subunit 1 [Coraliihabitans acroporae]